MMECVEEMTTQDLLSRHERLKDEIEQSCITAITKKAGKPDRWRSTDLLMAELDRVRGEIKRRADTITDITTES